MCISFKLYSTLDICITLYYHFTSVFTISLCFSRVNSQLCLLRLCACCVHTYSIYIHTHIRMFTLGMDFFPCFSLHFDHQQVSECFISVSDEDHGIILLAFRHVSDIIRPMVTRKRKTTYLHAWFVWFVQPAWCISVECVFYGNCTG